MKNNRIMKALISLLIIGVIIIPGGNTQLDHMFSVYTGEHYIHILELLYAIIILLWLMGLLIGKFKIVKSKLNLPLITWYVYIIFSIFIGSLNSNSFKYIASDFRTLMCYSIFFPIMSIVSSYKGIELLCKILIFGMLIYSLEIVSVFVFKNYFLSNFLQEEYRIGFRTSTLSVIVIPLLFALIYYSPKIFNKILYAVISIPLVCQLILSQGRALWVTTFLSLIILFFSIIYLNRRKLRWLAKRTVILLMLICLNMLAMKHIASLFLTESWKNAMLNRIKSVSRITESGSFRIRLEDNKYLVNIIEQNPFLGCGLGTLFFTHTDGLEGLYIDNSYLTLIGKTGIVGLFLFLWVISIPIRRIIYIAKNLDNIETPFLKGASVMLISILPGFFIVTFLTSCLTHYRIIFIFGTMIATVEILSKKVKNKNNLSSPRQHIGFQEIMKQNA